MHVLGLIIAVVAGAAPEKQAPAVPPVVAPALTAPPLVAADEEVLAPTAPRRVVTRAAPAPVKLSERVTPAAPASRFGIIALVGAEAAVPVNGATPNLGLRAGMGVRFALLARSDDPAQVNATPSVGLVAGYAGLAEHRLFTEVRTELIAASGGGLFLPGFTVYALSGLDTHLNGDGVDPYVGMGIGWYHNVFKPSGSPSEGKPRWRSGGWGGGLGGGGGHAAAILLAGAVAVAAVIGFVCAGRVEIRYHPSPPQRAPPNVSLLVGFGL